MHRFTLFLASILVVCSSVITTAATADSGGAIQIGGKKAAVLNGAIDSNKDGSTLSLSIESTYIALSGVYELGAGVSFIGNRVGKDGGLGIISPGLTARINSPFFGPEENFLAYVGANVGIAFIIADAVGPEGVSTETEFSGGPKLGVEYYFSPRVAFQLEDRVTFSKDASGDNTTDNRLAVGIRILF